MFNRKKIGWVLFTISMIMVLASYVIMYFPPEQSDGFPFFAGIITIVFSIISVIFLYHAHEEEM